MKAESITTRVKREARMEIDEEIISKAKETLKTKLRELASAKRIVANITREIQELELKLDQDLSDA